MPLKPKDKKDIKKLFSLLKAGEGSAMAPRPRIKPNPQPKKPKPVLV